MGDKELINLSQDNIYRFKTLINSALKSRMPTLIIYGISRLQVLVLEEIKTYYFGDSADIFVSNLDKLSDLEQRIIQSIAREKKPEVSIVCTARNITNITKNTLGSEPNSWYHEWNVLDLMSFLEKRNKRDERS